MGDVSAAGERTMWVSIRCEGSVRLFLKKEGRSTLFDQVKAKMTAAAKKSSRNRQPRMV